MKKRRLLSLAIPVFVAAFYGVSPASASLGGGVGNLPQGTQSDSAYAASFAANSVKNVFATTSQVSCYRPEVPAPFNNGPNDGYSGESVCPGATTGEDIGTTPYRTQAGSNPGSPAATPMLVKDFSESDIRVDPTNSKHLIGSSKWIVSPEGYNHLLGFYESFDGGTSWPTQGHIPGYEGWTDNTDPVGAFDAFGNFYELILPYQFFYNADGSHNFSINPNQEPNPAQIAEVIAAAVHPKANPGNLPPAQNWITNHNGHTDTVATYDSRGNEPDKQWLTIDTNPDSPHKNRIYAMWVDFHGPFTSNPFVSFADANPDGTHTDWSTPQLLPFFNGDHPSGGTYLLPHVTPDGTVWTTVTTTEPSKGFCCDNIILDKSTDGGVTWTAVSQVADAVTPPPLIYPNTTFRDGIENTFAVGNHLDGRGFFPLYVSWEDFSAGVDNVILDASFDGGATWVAPIQVNDNSQPVDEFQPNLTVAANGRVSVAFYDRRLACPTSGTAEAAGAGIALDKVNPNYSGSLPPYGATNYCVNASIQFYKPDLTHIGNNIRLSQHTWDGQLNSPHPGRPGGEETFIGDYFGNTTGATLTGLTDYTTSTSTFNDGSNPDNRQQQVIATVAVP